MLKKKHVHGEVNINVVVENSVLSLEIEMPLDVLVGFEHEPKNNREKADFENAVKILREKTIFTPNYEAQCVAKPAVLNLPSFKEKSEHSDIDGDFSWECAKINELKLLEVGLFQKFKRLEKLQAQVVDSKGQNQQNLSPSKPRLTLR